MQGKARSPCGLLEELFPPSSAIMVWTSRTVNNVYILHQIRLHAVTRQGCDLKVWNKTERRERLKQDDVLREIKSSVRKWNNSARTVN